jgi:hypothetical protein
MSPKVIKVITLAASGVSILATLVGNWAGEKQLDAKIAEKAAEAVAKLAEKDA